MGKLRDWLLGDGDRPRWSILQFAVAAYAEDLQDELQDEWYDWKTDDFASEFDDSCSECDDDEAVDRAREWLGWSPIDRRADRYSDGDEEEDNVPLDDSTYGEGDEPRLTDDRRLQDMIDATPCVVVDFLLAHGRQIAESELEDAWQHGFDEGYGQGWQSAQKAGPSGAQGAGRSEQQARPQCQFFKQGTCRNGDACRFAHS